MICRACGQSNGGGYLTSGTIFQINRWIYQRCGDHNSGTYEVVDVGGQLQVALHDMSIQQLLQIRAVLRGKLQQRPETATLADVAASVESVSPALATWVRTVNDNQGVIAVVAAAPRCRRRGAPARDRRTVQSVWRAYQFLSIEGEAAV
jgi:hypothetical protein